MELEEAIKKLKNPKNIDLITLIRQFKREGIENFVVTKPDIIETVLNHITKQEKMIELMAEHISFGEDIQKILCSPKVHKEGACTCITCKRCIKQYFEKKAEEEE